MIFRRFTSSSPNRNTTKNHTPGSGRNSAQQFSDRRSEHNHGRAQTSLTTDRREPALGHMDPHSNRAPDTQMTLTPPLHGNPSSTSPLNTPTSPLAMAQTRRNSGSTASSTFSRQDQSRKLIVGREISLNGEITTCDHLVVEGAVNATVKDGQMLEILEKGSFSGTVTIEQADIAGTFEGELTVHGKLSVRASAHINGTIHCGSMQVEQGATLTGNITCTPQQKNDAQTIENIAQQSAPSQPQPNALNTNSVIANIPGNTTNMQQNAFLSSVLEQPGFLKASGQ